MATSKAICSLDIQDHFFLFSLKLLMMKILMFRRSGICSVGIPSASQGADQRFNEGSVNAPQGSGWVLDITASKSLISSR